MIRLGLYISNLYLLRLEEKDLRKRKSVNTDEFIV